MNVRNLLIAGLGLTAMLGAASGAFADAPNRPATHAVHARAHHVVRRSAHMTRSVHGRAVHRDAKTDHRVG
jgi:hypothetical protein